MSFSAQCPLSDCTVWEFFLWCCHQRWRWQVQGRSMIPTLHPGDQVLVHPGAYRHTSPQIGDIVLARHPFQSELCLVKRIQSVKDNDYFLIGDNLGESTDSRVFQAISGDFILGKVTSLF